MLEERKSQMDKLLPNGYYYFHDKHPVHKSHLVNGWARDHNMVLNLLPSKASDLNPIENLWGWLKGSVARDSPRSEGALIKSLKKIGQKLIRTSFYLILTPYMTDVINV